uniref:uncharacterized protein LOC120330624 n=1 Tax=Styela clava TaxID=7725 RepID=UPI00193ACEE9|nr:uncharacterized protein LOC120330624 [Styela clava]
MPKASLVQSNLCPSDRKTRIPFLADLPPRKNTTSGANDTQSQGGARVTGRASNKEDNRLQRSDLSQKHHRNVNGVNYHRKSHQRYEARSRKSSDSKVSSDVSQSKNSYLWSKLNLSSLDENEEKSEVVSSMRQTNVLLSPRVYDAVPVSSTTSQKRISLNELSVRKSHVQQVTVGPVESDSVSDLLFSAENYDPNVTNNNRSRNSTNGIVTDENIYSETDGYFPNNTRTKRIIQNSNIQSRTGRNKVETLRKSSLPKHKKTSPRLRNSSPLSYPSDSDLGTKPRTGQKLSNRKENEKYNAGFNRQCLQISTNVKRNEKVPKQKIPHGSHSQTFSPKSRKSNKSTAIPTLHQTPKRSLETLTSPAHQSFSNQNLKNSPILSGDSLYNETHRGEDFQTTTNGVQKEILEADMEHLINQRFLAGLRAGERSFLGGFRNSVDSQFLPNENGSLLLSGLEGNGESAFSAGGIKEISDESLHVSELDSIEEYASSVLDDHHDHLSMANHHPEVEFHRNSSRPGDLSQHFEGSLLSSSIDDYFSPAGSRNVSNENFVDAEKYHSKNTMHLHSPVSAPLILQASNSTLFSQDRDNFLSSDGIHNNLSPRKQVHFKDPISISTQISPRPIISLEDLGLGENAIDYDDAENTELKMSDLSEEEVYDVDGSHISADSFPYSLTHDQNANADLKISSDLKDPKSFSERSLDSINHDQNANSELEMSSKLRSHPIRKFKSCMQTSSNLLNHGENDSTRPKISSKLQSHQTRNLQSSRLSSSLNRNHNEITGSEITIEKQSHLLSNLKPSSQTTLVASTPKSSRITSPHPRKNFQNTTKTYAQLSSHLPTSNLTKTQEIPCKKSSTQPQASIIQQEHLPQLETRIFETKFTPQNFSALRDQRLCKIVEKSPPKERNNVILKSRYFRIWKENVRLLKAIKSKENLKLLKAISFQTLTTAAKHFIAWRSLILRHRLAADELKRYQLIRKGFSALHWAVSSRKMKDNQVVSAGRRLKFAKCFMKWKKRYKVKRYENIKSTFTHWKTCCKNKIIIGLFESRRERIVSLQTFFFWRERFHSSSHLRIASEHYDFVMVRRSWQLWRIFTAERVVLRSQLEVADIKHESSVLSRTLLRWKNTTIKTQYARMYNRKKVLSSSLKQWKHSTSLSRIQHRKEIASAREIRRKCLLRFQFKSWVTELNVKRMKENINMKNIRHCILIWKGRIQKHRIFCAEIASQYNYAILRKAFCSIKGYTENCKEKRCQAIQRLEQFSLRKSLLSWHQFTMRKVKLRNMQKTFQVRNRKKCMESLSHIWRTKFNIIQAAQEQYRQWTIHCVQTAAYKWLHLLRLKQMDRKCDMQIVRFRKRRLRNRFESWKRKLHKERKSEQRAADGRVVLLRHKMRRILRNWNLRAQESVNIKPLIERMNRKRIARYFDAWALLRNRQVMKENMNQLIQTHSLQESFQIWKNKLNDRNNIEKAEEMHEKIMKRRALKGWKKFLFRCHGYAVVSNQHHRMLLLRLFYTWATKTTFKQIEESRKLHEHFLRQVNAHEILARWNSATKQRKINEEDNIQGFREKHDLSTKSSKFKYWSAAALKQQRAKKFASMNTKKKIKELFIAWNTLTSENFQKKFEKFSSSLKMLRREIPQAYPILKAVQVEHDVTGNDVITQTSFNGDVTMTNDETNHNDTEIKSSSSETGFSETSTKITQLEHDPDFLETREDNRTSESTNLKRINSDLDTHSIFSSCSIGTQNSENSILQNGCADSGILLRDYISTATSEQDEISSVNSVKVNGFQQTGPGLNYSTIQNNLVLEETEPITLQDLESDHNSGSLSETKDVSLPSQKHHQNGTDIQTECTHDTHGDSKNDLKSKLEHQHLELIDAQTQFTNDRQKNFEKGHQPSDLTFVKTVNAEKKSPNTEVETCKSPILHHNVNYTTQQQSTQTKTTLPACGDPYLQPVLSEFSHMSFLPILNSHQRTHVPQNQKDEIGNYVNVQTLQGQANTSKSCQNGQNNPKFHEKSTEIYGNDEFSNRATITTNIEAGNGECQQGIPRKRSKIPVSLSKITPKNNSTPKHSRNYSKTANSEDSPPSSQSETPKYRISSERSYFCVPDCATLPKNVLEHEDNIETAKVVTPRKLCDKSTDSNMHPKNSKTRNDKFNFPNPENDQISPILSSTMMDRSINTENFGVESSISSNEDDTSISIMTSSLSSSDAIIDEIYDVIEPATREILKRKPKPVLPIHPCLRDSSIPTIEWLVRLAVIRMRYRPLAFAFHQWKLLIHTKKWEQEMLAHMKERTRFLNIKQYLRQWKTNYKKATSSRNHYKQNLEQRCFHEWLQWTTTKRARQRMKTEADRIYSSKLLRSAMNTWNGKWQHRLALLEILKYWQTRTKQHNSPRMKDERTQHRLNSELLSNCFERWRLKYRQIALSDQHRRKTLLGGILTAWSSWASERAEVSMRISDMRAYHLKRRIFIAWKKHTSLMKQVELIRKRSLRNWISSLLDRWHQYATAKHHHDSALDKISSLSQSSAVQTCLDRWRLEFTKRKLADTMNRRSLMKKAIHEWNDVTIAWAADRQRIETMRRTVATNQKRTALTNWRNELALKAKVESAREQRYSNLLWRSWCLWRERVALKRASHAYMLFLKRRTFNSWKKFLQQKRNSDEKARTVLLKWHEMIVRSQNLSCMADQFQMKSCNFTIEFTFNTWLIAHSQNKIAKLHYKNKILRKSFAAILSRTKRKQSLKRMQMNFVRQRTKELFAFSWHKWKYRLQLRLQNSSAIDNHKRAVSHRLLVRYWTAWKARKRERDAIALYQQSSLRKCFTKWEFEHTKMKRADRLVKQHQDRKLSLILTTWWTCSSTLRNERRVVSDLEESRNKIMTITTFMVWLKSYKNNKIACKFAENKMKKKAFNSLKIWKTESIRLKKCYSQAVQIVETLMLKFYFTQWKSMFRKVRMLEVTCDRMMEVKSNKMLKSSWKKWFKAKENRDLQRRHERDLAFDVITKWRRYAADRVEKQRIREERNVMVGRFEQKWIWNRSFSKWKGKYQVNQFSRKKRQKLLERCWYLWSSKTAMIICAVEMDYHWTLRKYWHWWRLEHVTKKSTNEAAEQMNHDMKKTIFKLWRAYTYKKLTGHRYCSAESLKPEALTPRKRSRIPVLKK